MSNFVTSYVAISTLNRPVARGFGRFGRTALRKKGPLSYNERSTFQYNKLHLLKPKVHCYNYTIQGCRKWPSRLSSYQAKVSPTIKKLSKHKQEILLQNDACYCFSKAFALLQIEYYIKNKATNLSEQQFRCSSRSSSSYAVKALFAGL